MSKNKLDLLYYDNTKDKKMLKELRKTVNIYDMTNGLDLEEPGYTNFMVHYDMRKRKFVNDLLYTMNVMNGTKMNVQNPDLFVRPAISKHGRMTKEFRESELWKKPIQSVDYHSTIFKRRFFILLYSEMSKYIDEIVDIEYKRSGTGLSEMEEKDLILKKIYQVTREFQEAMFSYKPLFYPAMDLDRYLCTRKKSVRNEYYHQMIDHLEIILANKVPLGYRLDDDVIINDITKLAYIVTTGNPKLKNTFPTEVGVSFYDYQRIRKIIILLGRDIIYYKNTHPNIRPLLYDCFLYARPEYQSRFPIEEIRHHVELRTGIRALNYLAFITKTKAIDQLVQKIV